VRKPPPPGPPVASPAPALGLAARGSACRRILCMLPLATRRCNHHWRLYTALCHGRFVLPMRALLRLRRSEQSGACAMHEARCGVLITHLRRSGVRLMLHDPPEAPWDWPTSKTRPAAASGSDGGFSGSQDARVPAPGQINGAADPDLLEITFKNDVRCCARLQGSFSPCLRVISEHGHAHHFAMSGREHLTLLVCRLPESI